MKILTTILLSFVFMLPTPRLTYKVTFTTQGLQTFDCLIIADSDFFADSVANAYKIEQNWSSYILDPGVNLPDTLKGRSNYMICE